MAIKINNSGTGRTIIGPRGGRRRSTNFDAWLTHAAGVPTFSTVNSATGKFFAVMQIDLVDGLNWSYLWFRQAEPVVWSWGTATVISGGIFVPSDADGASLYEFGPAFNGVSALNTGTIVWDQPAQQVVFAGAFGGTAGGGSGIFHRVLDTPGHTFVDDFGVTDPPAGPWSHVSGFPDGSVTPITISFSLLLYNGNAGTLDMTCTSSKAPQDFWSDYLTYPVPGYPSPAFGEWFNAVAWGSQFATMPTSDLAAWLAAN